MIPDLKLQIRLGWSQYHLAVAGGCEGVDRLGNDFVPTRYREVVLTLSKHKALSKKYKEYAKTS